MALAKSIAGEEDTAEGGGQTRTHEAFTALARLARDLGPDGRMPTFVELRGRLGVSVATLNRALAMAEARRVLYRRHGVGIFVSPDLGRKSVALVCAPRLFEGPEVSPFWQILVERVREHATARRHEFTMHFAGFDNAERPLYEDFMRSVTDRRVQGVLSIGARREAVDWITDQGVPVTAFAGPAPYTVDVDYRAVVREAVADLAARGCRRLGLWVNHTPRDLPPRFWEQPLGEPHQVEPFRAALGEHGLSFEPELVYDSRSLKMPGGGEPPRTFWEQGYQIAAAVFGPDGVPEMRPDGIVSPSELFAQGVLVGLQRFGARVGKDVRLATHANRDSPILAPWAEEITRLEVSPAKIAQAMLEMLEAAMAGEVPPEPHLYHRPKLRPPSGD